MGVLIRVPDFNSGMRRSCQKALTARTHAVAGPGANLLGCASHLLCLPATLRAIYAPPTHILCDIDVLARSPTRVSSSKQIADHRHRIGPGTKNVSGRLYSDSPDGDKRFSRQFAGSPHKLDAHNRIRVLLGARREDRPHSYIVRRSSICRAELLKIVCRNTHPEAVAADCSRRFDRKIVLSYMNATSPSHCGDIDAVVDHEARPGGGTQCSQFPGFLQHRTR